MNITDNGKAIINYLRSVGNADATATDISAAVGNITPRQVNGATNALVKNNLALRVEGVPGEDGKTPKYIKLTDLGMTVEL